jgi:hypothetical protein
MSDMSVADFRRKKEHKVEKMESTREEQELKEQQRLDEEEIEFGTLDYGRRRWMIMVSQTAFHLCLH